MTSLVPVKEQGLTEVKEDNSVIIFQGKKQSVVQVRPKTLTVAGKKYNIDPHQLIRMIKQVTQTIGEYKDQENPYSAYVVGAMRKARSDMVSDLEHHFGIHWQIDEVTGKSVFYM